MWKKLKAFITVAEQAGFAKAAKKMGLSNATITRYIQELETEYQIKFFTRTTRHISLTEQGEMFYHHALELIQLHDEAQDKFKNATDTVQGNIKIGLPLSILHQFAEEKIASLLKDYTDLSIEIIQGNHITDLLSGHFDLVIHCGEIPNVHFYFEKIATWQKVICASPSYLKKFNTPKNTKALSTHHCLDHAENHTFCWPLVVNQKLQDIPLNTRIRVNSSMVLKQLATQGLGIVYLPSFTIQDALANKTLVPILKNAWPEPLPIYALYPLQKRSNKKLMIVVEAFRDLLNLARK